MKEIDYDKLYDSNNYGKMKILEYLGNDNGKDFVNIKFINAGNIRKARLDSVLNGTVRDYIYENLDPNEIHHSNYYGDYKILSTSPGTSIRHRTAIVQFIDTGYTYETTLYAAINGTVRDALYGIDYNKIYYSNINGSFKIIKYLGIINHHTRVLIQFTCTNTIKDVQLQNALDGKVSDPNLKIKLPINSSLPIDNYNHRVNMTIKSIWEKMMDRCYNVNSKAYEFYGGIGVSVHEDWHNFDIFANDITNILGYADFYNSPFTHSLDKDYLQLNTPKNLRIYSKYTCCFLSSIDNKNLSSIEFRNNNIDKLSSQYFGVTKNSAGNFQANIIINGNYFYIGTFNNEIMAAAAYNYWCEYFHNYNKIPLFNNIPYISPNEFIQYNINPKEMCSIVKI